MTVSIERAGVGDAGEVLTLQRAAYVTEAQLYGDPHLPPLTQTLDELVSELSVGTCLKATSGQRIVGAVRARHAGDIWHIGRLMVAPDQQGLGIGTSLLRAVEAEAPAPVATFALFTGADSASNVRLYERCGYSVVRRESLPRGPGLVHLEKRRA